MAIQEAKASLEAHYATIPGDTGKVIGVEVLANYTPILGGPPRDVLKVVLNLNALPWGKYCPEAKTGIGWTDNGDHYDVAAFQRGVAIADSVPAP